MIRALLVALAVSTPATAGEPVQFCVGERTGPVQVCAPTLAELPDVDGQLFALDAVGNSADWGRWCTWRGARVAAMGAELTIAACDEAKRRLEEAAAALTRAGLVPEVEWARVVPAAVRGVLLYPVRFLDAPRGEEANGVYVPATAAIHLTGTLEAAPHELFHAVLQVRSGAPGHDGFPSLLHHLQRAFSARYRARPVL